MQVKALEACFVDGNRRREGEVFEYKVKPHGKFPRYLKSLESPAPAADEPTVTVKRGPGRPPAGD